MLDEVVKVAGGKAPKLEDLVPNNMARDAPARPAAALDAKVRELLGPVIRLNAKDEDVEKAAKALEEYAKDHQEFKIDVGRRAKLIVDGGKVDSTSLAPLVARHPFPLDWPVLLFVPRVPVGLHGVLRMIAFVRGVSAASRSEGDMCHPFDSCVSTMRGSAPTIRTCSG